MHPEQSGEANLSSLRRVIVVFGTLALIIVSLLVFKDVVQAFFLYYAAGIVSLILVILAGYIRRLFPLISHFLALLISVILILGFFFLISWTIGPQFASQMKSLTGSISNGITTLQNLAKSYPWIQFILDFIKNPQKILPGLVGGIGTIFVGTFETLSKFLFVLLMGLFLAVNPRLYIDNAVRLFYPHRRPLVKETIDAIDRALRRWLFGRVLAMIVVGIATTIGLFITGVPLAIALGIIAGLLDFIPFIGPFISAVPAILVALAVDPVKVLWVIVVYLGAHLVEDFVGPAIQFGVTAVPPALLVSTQIIFTIIGGVLGILLAEPLTITLIIIVQMFYFKAFLHENVTLMGEKKR